MRLLFGSPRIAVVHRTPRPAKVRLGEVAGEAREALRLAVEALDAAGATSWVTYGTLLGLVREGRLLSHDDDVDIAVMAGADAGLITAEMAARGLRLILEEADAAGVTKLKYALGTIIIDLFVVRDEGALWADYCKLVQRSLVRSTHPPIRVEGRDLDGLSLPVPTDTEAYLEHLYGPGWRQPVTKWHWYLSPANSEVFAHWRELPRLGERWLRWMLLRR